MIVMHKPFVRASYPLHQHVSLKPLGGDDAAILGARLAELEPWYGLGMTDEALTGYLVRDDPCLRRYAIWAAEGLAGVVTVRYPWLRGAYLELLGVLPAAQRCGIGRRLIEWMVTETSPRAANLWTTVSKSNQPARRFYEALGFTPIGEVPGLVRDDHTEILLRRILRSVLSS